MAARGSIQHRTAVARPATTTTRTTATTISDFVAPVFDDMAETGHARRSPVLHGETERAIMNPRPGSCVGGDAAAERIITRPDRG